MRKIKLLALILGLLGIVAAIEAYSIQNKKSIQNKAKSFEVYKNKDLLVTGNCSDAKKERIIELVGTKIVENKVMIRGLDHKQNLIVCPVDTIIMKNVSPIYKANYIAKDNVESGKIKGQIVHLTGVCQDLKNNKYELTMSKTHVIDYQEGVLNGAVLSLNKIVRCDPKETGNFVIQASLLTEDKIKNQKQEKK